MQDFDRVTWFDATERKIAGDRYTYGFDQTKEHWTQFQPYHEAYEKDSKTTAPVPVPDGYTAPSTRPTVSMKCAPPTPTSSSASTRP
ncbi:hypothetical protein NKH18_06875 [Streptomyces sp. M10(2022)]